MNWVAAREGAGIAIEALRSNKVRAALTILGIVIGVATVMAMAAVIGGIRASVTEEIESIGPTSFVVSRFDNTELNFTAERPPWEGTPQITLAEAELLADLPSVQSVTVALNASATLRRDERSVSGVNVQGQSADWTNYTRGDFIAGRNYLPTDVARSAPVAVLAEETAEALFANRPAVGREVRFDGARFEVIGVYRPKPNLFAGAGPSNTAWIPHSAATKRLDVDDRWTQLLIVPTAGASQEEAMDDVTAALRVSRGLRPGEENNFALIRQEAVAELFDRLTGVFFLVMLTLSGIGLMVGGIGVVAIMMISVTERTREIGVRKALGATRREILWQFLIESVTVTTIGGVLGLLLGGGGAALIAAFTPIPASVPLGTIVAALLVFAVSGILFGVVPATRAARLDPVEALRHE